MARCARYLLTSVRNGIPSLCARGKPKTCREFSFSFLTNGNTNRACQFSSFAASPAMNRLSLGQNNVSNIQTTSSLHTLCQQPFTAHQELLPTISVDRKLLPVRCDSRYVTPVRTGTGSRGSMPHPTANIPIAVIGPNCQLDTQQAGWANELLITLDPEMRHQLFDALREYESMVWSPGKEAEFEAKRLAKEDDGKRLTGKQLRQLAFFSGLPFVGFGTLDNLIMISAGEYIDQTFGAMLGISTMAAAALGNMVSDVVGLGTAGYVENLARKMGVQPPKMSPIQLDLTSTKLTSNLGRVIGVLIGCTIGMMPLFFVSHDDDDDDDEEQKTDGAQPNKPEPETPKTDAASKS